MSYYNTKISDADTSGASLKERFLDYAHNWRDDSDIENKRVKIIKAPSDKEGISFEDKINSFIEENAEKIKIVDIKYQRNSVLIIYIND